MKHLVQFIILLCVFLGASVKAQNGNVQADMTTGLLWRPAALFTNATNVSTIASSLSATFQPLDSDLTAIAAVSTSAYGRSFLALADASAARTLTGTVIGTDVQAYDSDLAAVAALTTTSYGRNFLALADAAAARTLVGLSSADSPTFTALTLTGNLNTSDGFTVSSAGSIALTASGTNESITLTPSGTGAVVATAAANSDSNIVSRGNGNGYSYLTIDRASNTRAGALLFQTATATNFTIGQLYNSGSASTALDFATGVNVSNSLMRLTSGGSLLLGTTTDSSNGKLQLATHTTAAGGIGFGTDVTLYRSAADQLRTDDQLVVGISLLTPAVRSGALSGQLELNGGSGPANSANIILYGSSHATKPNVIEFLRSGAAVSASFNASGNFGLMAASSIGAWHTAWKAFQMGAGGALAGYTDTAYPATELSSNSVSTSGSFSTGYTYINTGAATTYLQDRGAHYFKYAASGTAGAAITWGGVLDMNATRVNVPQTTASTSTTTGSLTTAGGAGIGGALNVGGSITTAGTVTAAGIDLTQTYQTRKTSDVLFSDGATTNRRTEATFGTAGAVAGLPITIPFEFDVPTSNPSANIYVGFIGPTATPSTGTVSDNANALQTYITSGGAFGVAQTGASGADRRVFSITTFRTTYSGQRIRGVVVFELGDTATSPKIYVNGVDVSSSFTLSTSGTPPNWMPTTLDTTKFLRGYNWPAGRFIPHAPILGALSADEVRAWTQTGRLPTWCEVGTGSAVSIVTGDNRNFDASLGNWSAVGAGASVTYDAANKELDVVPSAAGKGANLIFATAGYTAPTIGRRYRATYQIANLTAGAVRLQLGGSNQVINDVSADGTYSVDFDVTVAGASGMMFLQKDAVSNTFSLKLVELRYLGPIAKWEIQPGGVTLADSGDNRIPLLLTAGVTAIGEKPEHISVLSNQMTADGFVLADQVITPTGYELVAAYAARIAGSGTGSLTVKETSSGGTTVATGTVASGTVALTVSNGLLAGGKKLHLSNSSWSSTTVQLRFVFRRAI